MYRFHTKAAGISADERTPDFGCGEATGENASVTDASTSSDTNSDDTASNFDFIATIREADSDVLRQNHGKVEATVEYHR